VGEAVCTELKVHFTEAAVENISDEVRLPAGGDAVGRIGTSGARAGEGGKLGASGIGSASGGRNGIMERGEFYLALDDKGDGVDQVSELLAYTVVPPSAALAAPIFAVVASYDEIASAILVQEGLYRDAAALEDRGRHRVSSTATNAAVQSKAAARGGALHDEGSSSASGIVSKTSHLTILQRMALAEEEQQRRIPPYRSVTLEFMKTFVSNELLPITQSFINSEMREMQTDPSMFSIRPSGGVRGGLSGDDRRFSTSAARTVSFFNQNVDLNSATWKCSKTAQLLFRRWAQLPLHR
jgi:hypothetical protein